MSWKPILPEGVTRADRPRQLAIRCHEVLNAAYGLKEMASEWRFFSAGCLYTYGGLDYDIVAEYAHTHEDRDCLVLTLDFPRPLFAGLCPPGLTARERYLERQLLATPLEYWDGLRDRIAGTAMVDRRRGRYAQVTVHDLEIVDQLAVGKGHYIWPNVPTAEITAFGIDGTHVRVGFVARVDAPEARAAVVRLPVREDTLLIGNAILANDPRPLVATLENRPADPADVARKVREAEEKI